MAKVGKLAWVNSKQNVGRWLQSFSEGTNYHKNVQKICSKLLKLFRHHAKSAALPNFDNTRVVAEAASNRNRKFPFLFLNRKRKEFW